MDLSVTVVFLACVSQCYSSSQENSLIKSWSDLSPDARPVTNHTTPVAVKIDVSILRLIQLDRDTKVVHLIGWTKLAWKDELRAWSPDEYGGVDSVTLSSDKMWTPDVVLFNTLNQPQLLLESRVVIDHDGSATWIPMYRWSVVCDDTADPQRLNCTLKFGSWATSTQQTAIENEASRIDLSSYSPNPNWEMLKTKARKIAKTYACCIENYVHILYSFTLSLRSDVDGDADADKDAASFSAAPPFLAMLALSLCVKFF